MTREEEIKQAAYSQYCNSESICFTLMCESFKQGAEWSDSHPKNVWHDASETPQANYKNIIYQTNYYSMQNVHITYIPTCLRSCKITSNSWNEFVKEVNMKRWAYITDLLPKGGEK